MKLIFSEKYLFNEEKRKGRLAAAGLGEDEVSLGEQMQRHVILPHMQEIISQFFRLLRLDGEANQIFSRGFRDDKLEKFLTSYLKTLGVRFNQAVYFEQRLRMGIAHVNAGVTLVVFQQGYRILQQLLVDFVPDVAKNDELLRAFILKITTLDLIIATEIYQSYDGFQGENGVSNHSRGSVQKVLNRDQVGELILTGLEPIEGESSSCVAIARVDELNKIENVYGKETATLVRQGITDRLLATLRPGDGVGLISENRYLFVISHTELDHAHEICRRLLNSINEHPISADKITIPVTISLVLSAVDQNTDQKQLISDLELALTQSQHKGVNQLGILNGDIRH